MHEYGKDNIVISSKIGKGSVIEHFNQISNSVVGEDCVVNSSVIESSNIGNGVSVGPFARIRPNSVVGDNCRIGNFVELKNCTIGEGTKVSHLAYVGDVVIGKKCNIGCGVIFANYDGRKKSKTVVGNNVFVGSNTNIIAPVTIGDNVYICAGSTITHDIPSGSFVIGRSKEIIKPDKAKLYLKEWWSD